MRAAAAPSARSGVAGIGPMSRAAMSWGLMYWVRSSDVRHATPGAPGHAAGLELAQALLLAAIIDHDPDNQDQHHGCCQRVGCHDEGRIGTERHRRHVERWLDCVTCATCINCNARTRRRRISLRIAARCSVTNNLSL